ncbi:hypothetical protein [Novosphingobium resinovorum]|uniref:hypothetical protein n=1 Tax=Novosphingobium resinovorum TaxID=158500 RepID=UPI002ED1F8FD|nr:hypothetical protein [Novosphingobium resinovorum]
MTFSIRVPPKLNLRLILALDGAIWMLLILAGVGTHMLLRHADHAKPPVQVAGHEHALHHRDTPVRRA